VATAGREYSLDYHLLESMKYSGMNPENLADLVAIAVRLKNKYGIIPLQLGRKGIRYLTRWRSATLWRG
jgi:hypothetical protein